MTHDGLGDLDVAARLEVGAGTVRGHMASARAKLGLHKRSELVQYALTTGLSHLAVFDRSVWTRTPA